jgi:hypothetical protein
MTKMLVLTTLQDAAAAEVAREALADAAIPVAVRRLGGDVYLGSGTTHSYELRVADERLADARRVLAELEADMEQAAIAAAGVPPMDEDERGSAALPALADRPRKVAWAIALGLVGPLPGSGILYARSFKLGWTVVGMSLLSLIAGFTLHEPNAFGLFLALKGADVLLAPFLAARFNRKLGEQDAAQP